MAKELVIHRVLSVKIPPLDLSGYYARGKQKIKAKK